MNNFFAMFPYLLQNVLSCTSGLILYIALMIHKCHQFIKWTIVRNKMIHDTIVIKMLAQKGKCN